jgi:purine-binding chemotaxis protein CheW
MDEIDVMDQAIKSTANREGKYLTFSLAGEEYGIGILKVKENRLLAITTVPRLPIFVKGSQPVGESDSRCRPPISSAGAMDRHRQDLIVVVEIRGANERGLMGIVVTLSPSPQHQGSEIEEPPNFGSKSQHRPSSSEWPKPTARSRDPPRHRPCLREEELSIVEPVRAGDP